MNRKKKMLSCINKKGVGLEIGPCHSPVAPKRKGYKVEIIDHASRSDLIEKYKDHFSPEAIEKIEEVDYVWSGQSYAELTGKKKYYDWIIASHVIEHTPDMVGFLRDCAELLKEDGVLVLAVPDLRFCFDQFRPASGLNQVIDAHLEQRTMHTPGTIFEYYATTSNKGGRNIWKKGDTGANSLQFSFEQAKEKFQQAQLQDHYMDAHAWCFTQNSFRLIIRDLHELGFCPLQEAKFFNTRKCEFILSLSAKAAASQLDRLTLLENYHNDLRQGLTAGRWRRWLKFNS